MSAMARPRGFCATGTSIFGVVNDPRTFNRIVTAFRSALAIAMSGHPSWLRSAAASSKGPPPTDDLPQRPEALTLVALLEAVVQQDPDRVAAGASERHIGEPIAIEIRGHNRSGAAIAAWS